MTCQTAAQADRRRPSGRSYTRITLAVFADLLAPRNFTDRCQERLPGPPIRDTFQDMRDSGNRGTVVLGVGGGIAAYKVGDLVRRLRGQGLRVRVAMTPMAAHFVSPLTFQALSGEPVLTDLSDPRQDAAFGHLDLARSADVAIVAPATADLVGKLANGLCDDPVTTTLIASACPLLLCPAMNTAMWANSKVQRNIGILREDSRVRVIGPGVGLLADGDVGAGRLAEVPEIVRAALEVLGLEPLDERLAGLTMDGADLEGKKVLV